MRYHPLSIAFQFYQVVKNSLFIAIILFVVKRESNHWAFEYGRYVFLLGMIVGIIYIVISWFVEKYEWKDRTFHIHKGVFVKNTSIIAFSKIQNVTRKTTIFHKIVGLTSLTFETAMDGEDDAIHFEVISKEHANYLIDIVQPGKKSSRQNEQVVSEIMEVDQAAEETELETEPAQAEDRTVHFTPNRGDLWKASFTSLSFLAIIPIVGGLFENMEPLLPESKLFVGIYEHILENRWLLFGIILLAVIVAVGFGIARTFIRYGKYEISSDTTHIYIDRGVLDESYFAIEKRKIQGLEIHQTWLKRLFGLAEVKLISSSNPNNLDGAVNVNSLYPFLPLKRAYQLIEELLPIYQLNVKLERLPRKSLYVKLLRPSWTWVIATIALAYFKPSIFKLDLAWWIVSLIILFFIVLLRILDYIHTRYGVTQDQVQWWHGGLTSRMFITKRKNIIEIASSQTRLQKYFQVASITTLNRSTPVHVETIDDLPLPYTMTIEEWYLKRQEDVLLKK